MSRAYRIRVTESARRVIRAEDHVETCLELLDILPRETMAGMLRAELIARGFREEGGVVVRRNEGVVVTVDPCSGEVVARSGTEEEVELHAQGRGWADEDQGRAGRAGAASSLRDRLKSDLERQAERRTAEAQKTTTDRLEAVLGDLRAELDRAVNRVTAEALKLKAGQLGRIKEVTEDADAGSLTIVLEV